ncbi:MAG TPA: cupin domain-containing protein [Ktedonobacteraceae bacterium]|nr:cupin domain-containing protein [Ktedonobacteraceae bacterium]
MIKKVSRGTIFPREDGKIIDEHFGVLHTQQDSFSLAQMTAPPAWREAAQVADFDEILMVVSGSLAVEAGGERVEVNAGESCMIDRGTRVIYSNASADHPCMYWSLCIPAFRPERTRG